jgi:peptidoglycan hydrolase-like protein with peptidoglycan-binding domain
MRNIIATSILALSLSAIPVMAQGKAAVRDAQQALKDKGLDPGPVDGINGPLTKAAVKQYQEKQSLTANGRLDAKTLDSLGVKSGGQVEAQDQIKEGGSTAKKDYAKGGEKIGEGTKDMTTDVKHGEVGEGAVDLGKGVGKGAAKIGEGTGHAAKSVAKGVKNAVVPNEKKVTPDKP